MVVVVVVKEVVFMVMVRKVFVVIFRCEKFIVVMGSVVCWRKGSEMEVPLKIKCFSKL